MSGKDNIFLDDMAFERELDEMQKKGPTAVSVFTAREVHRMCKKCQQHDIDIKELKDLHPTKKDSFISGASGGAATSVVIAAIYYVGKWLHIWD